MTLRLMRGPSAEARAVLDEQLEAATADAGSPTTAQVGVDLFGVSAILRATPSLRRVLTDASIEGSAKTALAREVLGGQVDAVSLDLVATAVGRRWTAARDLPDTLEELGEVATVRSAGPDAGRVGDELFAVAQAVEHSPELRDALSDPGRSVADKTVLVESLIGAKALPATVTLVTQALAGTYRTVPAALAAYQQVAAKVQDQRVATVRVAQALSDSEHDRLAAALSRQYGRAVHLNVIVEPGVLGGIRVEIGDDVIDGTVASRLADAQRRLAG